MMARRPDRRRWWSTAARTERELYRVTYRTFSTGAGMSELRAVAHRATDEALIDAWGSTAALLVSLSSAAKVDRLADIRGVFLDEFELRDLGGFRSWLANVTPTAAPESGPR